MEYRNTLLFAFALFFLITLGFLYRTVQVERIDVEELLYKALSEEKENVDMDFKILNVWKEGGFWRALVSVVYAPNSNCPSHVWRHYTITGGSFDYSEEHLVKGCGVAIKYPIDTPAEAITLTYQDPWVRSVYVEGKAKATYIDLFYAAKKKVKGSLEEIALKLEKEGWFVVWEHLGEKRLYIVSKNGEILVRGFRIE